MEELLVLPCKMDITIHFLDMMQDIVQLQDQITYSQAQVQENMKQILMIMLQSDGTVSVVNALVVTQINLIRILL